MTNTNDKALTPAQEVAELWTTDQLSLIRNTIAPGISLSELHLFAMICKRTGLDPFTRQIYAIKRGDRMTVQTGIDGYRVLAVRTGELAGIDDAIYDAEDSQHPNRASVTVWRLVQGHRVAFTATARWSEYKPQPPNDKMWNKMPFLMLAKCAESLALRKAFPAELSGIYTAEEMAQADNGEVEATPARPPSAPARREPTQTHPSPPEPPAPSGEDSTQDEAPQEVRMATTEQIAALRKAGGLLGYAVPATRDLTYDEVESMLTQWRADWHRLQGASGATPAPGTYDSRAGLGDLSKLNTSGGRH